MPECYLLAVCMNSSLDASTNNYSLFTLVEEFATNEFPVILPMELHAYWHFDPHEVNVDFEFRVVFISSVDKVHPSSPIALKSPSPRYRLRNRSLPIVEPADYKIQVEWREQDSPEWTRCHIFWPFNAQQSPSESTPQ